jgi:hypothetical protein
LSARRLDMIVSAFGILLLASRRPEPVWKKA